MACRVCTARRWRGAVQASMVCIFVHCAAPSSVLGDVVPVDAHQHQHAFADLAHDLLVDGHARALDALQHETHCACVCCEEQRQQSCARQLGLSVQEFVKYSDGVASTASTRVVLAVAPRFKARQNGRPAGLRGD
jgi:hypothetical protein